MEIPFFAALVLLEILLVGLLYGIYLAIRSRRHLHAEPAPVDDAGPGGVDAYLEYLKQAILQTDARLAGMRTDEDTAADRLKTTELRLLFLKAEQKAVDQAGVDEDKLWVRIHEALTPLLPGEDAVSPRVESLKMQLQACRKRMNNLEQFRELFFDLKARFAETSARGDRLEEEVRRAVPVEQQSPELTRLFEELEQENRQMSEQLETVEEAFSDILHHAAEVGVAEPGSLAASMGSIDQGVETVRAVIARQEQRIAELADMLSRQEAELTDKEKLEQALHTMEESSRELESVIAVIEEENKFLQEQISMLLTQELEKEKERLEEIETLTQEREAQERAYAELSDKFANMETEYLNIYEEHQRIKDEGKPDKP